MDRPWLLTRGVEPQCDVPAWLRKLGPSWTLSERTFKHCVSPSPRGDRNDNALHPSQVAASAYPPLMSENRASLVGSFTRAGALAFVHVAFKGLSTLIIQSGQSWCSRKAVHQKARERHASLSGSSEIKAHGFAAAWLRNSFRSGLRPNGPSNMRLAIAYSDRSTIAMHSSQVAVGSECVSFRGEQTSKLGRIIYKAVLAWEKAGREGTLLGSAEGPIRMFPLV